MIPRYNIDNLDLLNVPDNDVLTTRNKIIKSWHQNLSSYNVVPVWHSENVGSPRECSAKELQLIFLALHMKSLVHKDLISAFVRKYLPQAGLDQQVRHLASSFWNVLNKGDNIPDEGMKVPSGYHYLVSLETPNPKAIAILLKRKGRINAQNWEDIKIIYDGKCATCGVKEGTVDTRTNKIVILQQGHMNPRKTLSIDNMIPQCQYCNQTYKDYFAFNEFGRVVAVMNPRILLKSPVDIQDEMIRVLLEERNKNTRA